MPCFGQKFQPTCHNTSLPPNACIQKNPPTITLRWSALPKITQYIIHRKTTDAETWGAPIVKLPPQITSFADTNVVVGQGYEYALRGRRDQDHTDAYGYLSAGIELPLVEQRGKLMLLIDQTLAADLDYEIKRLICDLAGDGWTVLPREVSRSAAPPDVKALITSAYAADPQEVKTVFLLGHIPIPFSGRIVIDGHQNNTKPWPADVYYGDMTGTWTDTERSPAPIRQAMLPGDGKFDQHNIPDGKVELSVGRVDLHNMPAFPKNETELIRQYLDKNHRFRHRHVRVARTARIDDHFGYKKSSNIALIFNLSALNLTPSGEGFASDGWRNFPVLVGAQNVTNRAWRDQTGLPSLLAGGWGAGSMQSCAGVITTDELAQHHQTAVFTLLLGSYFGDWSGRNNLMRAVLASENYGLTCGWAGRPHWFLHRMAMGEPIGESVRLTQMNNNRYQPVGRHANEVHIALMGDPSLRLEIVAPPANAQIRPFKNKSIITWENAPDKALGYNIYCGTNITGPFARINKHLITNTCWEIAAAPAAALFMVRAVALTTNCSGSFLNASQGIFATHPSSAPPDRASELVASAGQAGTPLKLTWRAVQNAYDYEIWRSANSNFNNAELIGDTQRAWFEDHESAPFATNYYFVRARNESGAGAISAPASGWRGMPALFTRKKND